VDVILDGTEEEITLLHELLVLPEVLGRLANVGIAERMQDVPFALGGIKMGLHWFQGLLKTFPSQNCQS